eukprot:366388-Chlamydomonas_euryale.AAC.10
MPPPSPCSPRATHKHTRTQHSTCLERPQHRQRARRRRVKVGAHVVLELVHGDGVVVASDADLADEVVDGGGRDAAPAHACWHWRQGCAFAEVRLRSGVHGHSSRPGPTQPSRAMP